jgi:hypothetical protein
VYARIAADEQRHAELAFRALAWLLADADLVRFAAACGDDDGVGGRPRDDARWPAPARAHRLTLAGGPILLFLAHDSAQG